MSFEHSNGFSCGDIEDALNDAELALRMALAVEKSLRTELGRLEDRTREVLAERDEAERVRERSDSECQTAYTSLARIHTWLGKAMEQRGYRGDFCDCEGLIEDAFSEAAERCKL